MRLVRFRKLAFLIAAFGQVALVLAATAEGWRPDASTHVERHGTQLHYAHNEATCPACTVQSMHARAEPALSPLPTGRARLTATVTRVAAIPFVGEPSSNGSRAPPTQG